MSTGSECGAASHIERGIHGPRFDLLEDIARTLGVAPRDLFDST